MLSWARSTTKELWTEYYEDQVKPLVTTARGEISNAVTQLKDHYNQEVEKANEKVNEEIQTQADQIREQADQIRERVDNKIQQQLDLTKDQINKLKVK